MLVERGLQVMNVEVVATPMPSRRTISARAIIVKIFQHGEFNKIKLANKAIAKFEEALLD